MKTLINLFLLLYITTCAFGQSDGVSSTNAATIDPNRYDDIKGSPYVFKDWLKADLIGKDKTVFKDLEINLNGYSKEFEIKRDNNKYIRLDEKWYSIIKIKRSSNPETFEDSWPDELIFYQGVHQRFGKRFVQALYQGKMFWLIKDSQTGLTEKEVNNVGKKVVFKRFIPKKYYYYKAGDKLSIIALKKKDVLKLFSDQKAKIEKLVKDEGLKYGNEADVIRIFEFYENM